MMHAEKGLQKPKWKEIEINSHQLHAGQIETYYIRPQADKNYTPLKLSQKGKQQIFLRNLEGQKC